MHRVISTEACIVYGEVVLVRVQASSGSVSSELSAARQLVIPQGDDRLSQASPSD